MLDQVGRREGQRAGREGPRGFLSPVRTAVRWGGEPAGLRAENRCDLMHSLEGQL